MASPARQTRPARLIHDFKLSPVCTKNACVTWHPAPSPPQHRDALTCPIPDTLSTNEPNIVARAIQYMLVTGCRVILCVQGDRSLQLRFYSAYRQKKKKKSETMWKALNEAR